MKDKQMKLIIKAITVNKTKKMMDFYSVFFWTGEVLTLSNNPDSPQGISMFGEYYGINDATFEEYIFDGTLVNGSEQVNFFDLPPLVQSHIEKRVNQINEGNEK